MAERTPLPLGSKTTVNVVVPVTGGRGEPAWTVTVKSLAWTPLTTTLGMPVRFTLWPPVLTIVKV